jgi:ferredoxin/flavodoxin---NADP+ reductase
MRNRKEQTVHQIISNELISPNVAKMVVSAPYVAQHRKAGQFIILRVSETGERIPLTIADSNAEAGTISLFYQIVGKTTTDMSKLTANDSLMDVAGPLGHPTEVKNYGTVACVGGGIGVAPIYPISSAMKKAGNRVVNIIGARNQELLILEDEITAIGDEIIVCTDDGSYGRKAFVTQALEEVIQRETVNIVVAVGPVPMMRALCDLTKKYEIHTMVSLNSMMVDGTGMCGGCRVTVDGQTKFTCVDGPEFDGHKVDFNELMTRLTSYRDQEQESIEHSHKCKLDGVTGNA